jgi:acetyl esterase
MDPEVRAVMDLLDAVFPRPSEGDCTIEEARAQLIANAQVVPGEEVASVEDTSIPGPDGNEIPVRIYRPEGDGPFPGVVYFHGGGFVLCGVETHDNVCRSLTKAVGCVTVSVDYRLAPEFPYPAGVEDAYAATVWVADHADELGLQPGRLAVAGDSAGGNLTAVVAQMTRDRGGPDLAYQLLIYPVIDQAEDHPSRLEKAEGWFLTKENMDWYTDHYLADPAHAEHPYASPIHAPDLSGLPPAMVITAEHDPLRDEGEAYGHRLREAGVEVVVTRYADMFHGFFSVGGALERSMQAQQDAFAALREALTSP